MDFSKFVHILNPNSKNRNDVQRFFKKRPGLFGAWVDRKSHPTHLETIIDWTVVEKRNEISVWGGDGSFSRVVQALYKANKLKDVTLCLVPAGTGNDFARNLKIRPWQRCAESLINHKGQLSKLDVGLLEFGSEKRIFSNNAGFGRTREALDRKKANPIKDILGFKEKKIQVEWGIQKVHQFETFRSFLGIVFNAPFFNKGMYFDKNIKPNDGLLQAHLVPSQNKASLFLKFAGSKMGMALSSRADMKVEAEFINIESDELLYPQVDGEPASKDGVNQLKFSILPGAMKLLVPTF